MQDITMYSDDELSLIVFNDAYLYNTRFFSWFIDNLEVDFTYTEKQLEVLKQDIADDAEEQL